MLLALLRPIEYAAVTDDSPAIRVAVQAAVALSLLYNCPDRAHDVALLRWRDIELVDPADGTAGGVRFHLRVNKTTSASRATGRFVFVADDDPDFPLRLLLQSLKARAGPGASAGHFCVLRPLVGRRGRSRSTAPLLDDDEAGAHAGRAYLEQLLATAMMQLPLEGPSDITLHSFRASGADAALRRGEPIEEILRDFNWRGREMLWYYTQCRTRWQKGRRAAAILATAHTSDDGDAFVRFEHGDEEASSSASPSDASDSEDFV
jgi:integrase